MTATWRARPTTTAGRSTSSSGRLEDNKRRGWAIAGYLVAQADRLDVNTVIFDDRVWRIGNSADGWQDYRVPSGSKGDRQILEHRDHVHVDVAR